MKSNIIMKGIAVCALAVVTVIGIRALKSESSNEGVEATGIPDGLSQIEHGPVTEDNGLEVDPLQDDFLVVEYGVDVDTPVETMRTLTNETRAVREESERLQEQNHKLSQNVERLLEMEEMLTSRINSRFTKAEQDAVAQQQELKQTQRRTNNLMAEMERRLDELQQETGAKGGNRSANGYDINSAGIPSGLGYDENGVPVDFDQIIWSNPIDAQVDPKKPTEITLPEFSHTGELQLPEIAHGPVKKKQKKEERSTPFYTIPVDGMLIGSVSLTAMLGRIPINGQVVDPYPFKIMVGPENLSSNGIHIPNVDGILMSGIAKGDWTLSCVSGEIYSMTFTFSDGTIVTHPSSGSKQNQPIAWFSDKNGIPCITGERISNAVSYLSSRVALTAASSYANAEAASQFTTTTNNAGGLTSGLTGDPKVVARNSAISGGLNEATKWLDERQESSFDAIYVPPGTPLAVHITQELKIDYDPKGRKVNYANSIPLRSDTHLD